MIGYREIKVCKLETDSNAVHMNGRCGMCVITDKASRYYQDT